MKDKLAQTKNKFKGHIIRNRAQYAFVAGIATGTYVNSQLGSQWVARADAFIESKGLTDEFHRTLES